MVSRTLPPPLAYASLLSNDRGPSPSLPPQPNNTPPQASEPDLQRAFRGGDNDDDDGLSLAEAGKALQSLSGKSVDAATIKAACGNCGVDLRREMNCELRLNFVFLGVGRCAGEGKG